MQPHQYRGYPQQGVPRPAAPIHHGVPQPSRTRGGIGPMMQAGQHHQMPVNPAQLAAQQQHPQAYANDINKRKSRKPNDKTLPPGTEDVVVDGGQMVKNYNRLRDYERRLDATITRKRVDIYDSMNRNAKRTKTLRIWISNTVEDQTWQGTGVNIDNFEFSANSEASYRVKLEGRLLDDDEDPAKEEDEAKPAAAEDPDKMDTDEKPKDDKPKKPADGKPGDRFRFSHFFKSLSVEFDHTARSRLGGDANIDWKKPDRTPHGSNLPAAADFDDFTFKRNGDENMNITINLYRDEEPEKFELSPELADVVDMKEATRQEVVLALWEYVKLMGLQEDEEKRNFRCDDSLRKILPRGTEAGFIPYLSEYITPHLKSLPPLKLPYTIRVDEEFHKNPEPTVYDVQVTVDCPLRVRMSKFYHNPGFHGMLKEVSQRDEQVVTIVNALVDHKARYDFMSALEADPVNFVRTWMSSQQRDLDAIMAESSRGGVEATGDEWRMGGADSVWGTANARESVNVLLAKQPLYR